MRKKKIKMCSSNLQTFLLRWASNGIKKWDKKCIIIYKVFYLGVEQGQMNGAPNGIKNV